MDSHMHTAAPSFTGLPLLVTGAIAGALVSRIVNPDPWRGKTVWVNGGSRGLGLLIAKELARRGCTVAITARSEKELAAARGQLQRVTTSDVIVQTCNVASEAEVNKTADLLHNRLGEIDILVNCASIIQVGPLKTMSAEDFERSMATSFFGYLYPILSVLPKMRERRAGTIVNIGSIGGMIAVPHLLPYSCAKFAVHGLSDGLRAELSNNGVRIIEIVPWLMRTGSAVKQDFKGAAKKEWAWFSLGDSLPLVSVNAQRAAQRIVAAIANGESRVTLGVQANIAETMLRLSPTTVRVLLNVFNRMLPKTATEDSRAQKGFEIVAEKPRSVLSQLVRRPAQKYNQIS